MRLIFDNKYSSVSKKCIARDAAKRFHNGEALRKRLKRESLKWIIPLTVASFILVTIGFVGVNRYQNDKFLRLEEIISKQKDDINRQSETNRQPEQSYNIVRDSLDLVAKKAQLQDLRKKRNFQLSRRN